MPGFYGSDRQIALQRAAEADAAWISVTPGACQACRFVGCDDPGRLGWDAIRRILDRDGMIGFRLLSPAAMAEVAQRLAPDGWRVDTWNVFGASAAAARAAIAPILALPLPAGAAAALHEAGPEAPQTRALQAFMADQGLAPFSGTRLCGDGCDTRTVVIRNADGAILASAHCYLPHGPLSPHHRDAWVGLVAVDPAHRGTGLGLRANAEAIRAALDDLGAEAVHELVSAANIPSQRMMARCGLALDPGRICGIALPAADAKFTR
ncbi:GNAT family N-acetyltransferase [Poseidonocella sp. HB161398]|uniref:GNAT family N-acetyltransferase n=1 Tax=Poseidonocella sp. HB161398 TaxID=2320855 RepID=UPI0011084F8D|nr:GNAT family N-acetyltransferase [Poseidonocella sp. HB161398]